MLDIGIVIPQLVKYGGAERVLIECLARWQHKHQLTVYATAFSERVLEEHGVQSKVTLKKLSPPVDGNAFSFLLNASFTPKLWSSEIGRHDVYNAHLWPMHLLDIAPCVWYPHEPLRMLHDLRNDQDIVPFTTDEERRVHIYPKYSYDTVTASYFLPMRRAAEAFDGTGKPCRIVANSRYCARYLKDVYGKEPSRIVYPGVTPEDFLPPMANDYILTVAQLWPHKRIHLILQSLRLVENIQLYIVGDGPEKAGLIRQAKELGVYDRTFFLSGLTNQELRIVFSRALAVAFMPIREPFGIVALEAMAASKPLIAADEGGYVEVVDSECAFLIPPRVDALAEKIAWLQQNPGIGAAMGRHGRELAGHYSWNRTASELLEEIEQACAESQQAVVDLSGTHKTLFGAQYYGWYGDGLGSAHWNDSAEFGAVRAMPALGFYDSRNADTVEQHLRMAEETGLDFFIFNLHGDQNGVSASELQAFSILLGKASALSSPVRICIQLCLYECPEADLLRLCDSLRETIFVHPSYFFWEKKPLLSIFWTGRHDGDRAFLQSLRKATTPAALLASSLRMPERHTQEQTLTLGIFDGWSMYSPLELSEAQRWEAVWEDAYANAGEATIRCATVSPGYDDTALTSAVRLGNPYRKIPREGGRTYRRMWEFAFKLPLAPHLVLISTFNEFHESTHIEPTVGSDHNYLELTRDSIRQGRALWNK